MTEKPFGPTATESLAAVFIGIIFVAVMIFAFLVKAKCYYETGKMLDSQGQNG